MHDKFVNDITEECNKASEEKILGKSLIFKDS